MDKNKILKEIELIREEVKELKEDLLKVKNKKIKNYIYVRINLLYKNINRYKTGLISNE
jgi:hypothetical protein